MFRYAIRYLAVVSALTVSLSAEQPPAPAAATEVERIERELVAAISAKDLATYDRLVADDYVVVAADGKESTKKEVMEAYRTGSRAYRNLQITNVKVHVYGDTAILSARTSGSRVEDGKEAPNLVQYLRVYARRAGRWSAVAQMSTPAPPR